MQSVHECLVAVTLPSSAGRNDRISSKDYWLLYGMFACPSSLRKQSLSSLFRGEAACRFIHAVVENPKLLPRCGFTEVETVHPNFFILLF